MPTAIISIQVADDMLQKACSTLAMGPDPELRGWALDKRLEPRGYEFNGIRR